jgi:hypothetical protein
MTYFFRQTPYFCLAKLFHGIKLGVKTQLCFCPFFYALAKLCLIYGFTDFTN